jgi:hypothetical protein
MQNGGDAICRHHAKYIQGDTAAKPNVMKPI